MRPVLTFAAAAVLVLASRGAADVALPKHLKYIDPRVAFEGVEKHPDYVFHLSYKTTDGNPIGAPYTRVEVKDDKAFTLKTKRRAFDFKLLAVGRKEFEARAKADPTLAWLTDPADGVRAAVVPTPKNVAGVDDVDVPVSTFKVTMKDGKLSVEAPPGGKGAAPTRRSAAPGWGVGVLAAVGLAWFGLWWARRG